MAAVAAIAMIAYGALRKRRLRIFVSPFETNGVPHGADYSSNMPSTPVRCTRANATRQLPQELGASGMRGSQTMAEEQHITEPRYVSVSIAPGDRAFPAPLADAAACYARPLDLIDADCGRILASGEKDFTTRFESCEGMIAKGNATSHDAHLVLMIAMLGEWIDESVFCLNPGVRSALLKPCVSHVMLTSSAGGMVENPVYAHRSSTGLLNNPVYGLHTSKSAPSAVEVNGAPTHLALADNPVYDRSHAESSSL
jgi:hypothetical protein